MNLPPDLTPSPLDLERLEEFTEFVQRVSLAESGRKHFTLDELRTTFGQPGFEPKDHTVVLRDPSGALVGVEWVERRPPFVQVYASGLVDPGRTGEGIGTALLEWAREVARSGVDDAPERARVAFGVGVDASHRPSVDLMTGFGLELTRYFLEMRIDFAGEALPPRFPDGVTVRTFVLGEDDALAYRAIDEAFRDHFGHVERPLEVGLARFRHWMTKDDFDPSLWWLAFEGDEVVGANLCEPSVEGDDGIGYVASLSVRRPWRGRGIAQALLLHGKFLEAKFGSAGGGPDDLRVQVGGPHRARLQHDPHPLDIAIARDAAFPHAVLLDEPPDLGNALIGTADDESVFHQSVEVRRDAGVDERVPPAAGVLLPVRDHDVLLGELAGLRIRVRDDDVARQRPLREGAAAGGGALGLHRAVCPERSHRLPPLPLATRGRNPAVLVHSGPLNRGSLRRMLQRR